MAVTEEAQGFSLPYRFGRYMLFDRIGKGGMAEIYLARGTTQMGAARLVVVKLVLPEFARDAGFEAMLITEARLAARLSHANIVQTFDLGREEARLFIAMEYVEGFDLNQLLKRLGAKKMGLPAEFGFFVVTSVLRALDYAHRRTDDDGKPLGLVHRDVSPSNVLISLEGEVKLCDFGIARAILAGDQPAPGALEGKYAYMAPETARGEVVDGRADVFAASIILWEMMAGRRMRKARPGKEVVDLARDGEVPELPNRGLPEHERLAKIIARGLSPDRDARYPTAGALLRDLEDYVAATRLIASPMRFGQFLQEHFEEELVAVRRSRELAAVEVVGEQPVEVIPMLDRLSEPPEEPPPAPAPPPDARPASTVTPAVSAPSAVSAPPAASGPPRAASAKVSPSAAKPAQGVPVGVVLAVVLLLVLSVAGYLASR